MASMAASGAIRLRCFLRTVSRAAAKIVAFSSGVPSFRLRSRVFGAGFAAISCAKATAPVKKSPSISRSRIPALSASSALTGFPPVHISPAVATPASRGRRCVPAAPERRAVNRHHPRLGAVLDLQQQGKQSRTGSSLGLGHLDEFFDVGPSNKSAPAPDDHGCDDAVIPLDLINGGGDAFRHARTQSVHRWVVDGDDRDIVMFCKLYELIHSVASLRESSDACLRDEIAACKADRTGLHATMGSYD